MNDRPISISALLREPSRVLGAVEPMPDYRQGQPATLRCISAPIRWPCCSVSVASAVRLPAGIDHVFGGQLDGASDQGGAP